MTNNFELTLDTLAPTGSIAFPKLYANTQVVATITKDSDASMMKVWFDKVAKPTKLVPEGLTEGDSKDTSVGYRTTDWAGLNTSVVTNFSNDGTYYAHLVLCDSVGNESEIYTSDSIIYDTTAPEVTTFVMKDESSGSADITNSNTVKYELKYFDVLAGCEKAEISGTYINTLTLNLAGSGTIEGQLTIKEDAPSNGDPITVSVKLTDRAGNVSEVYEDTIILDTFMQDPILELKGSDGKLLAETSYINYFNQLKAHLVFNNTDIIACRFWGDFVEGSEGLTKDWITVAAGTESFETPIVLTAGEGQKNIYAEIKDTAENTRTVKLPAKVTVDTTNPVIEFTTSKTKMSAVEEYNTAILTLSGVDSLAGIKSFELKTADKVLNNKFELDGSIPSSYELSYNDLVEGQNTLTFTVVDKANNSSTKSIEITLDIKAPAISINTLEPWYKEAFDILLTYTDQNAVVSAFAWVNQLETDMSVPSGTINSNIMMSPMTIAKSNVNFKASETQLNYLHIKVVDEVGNASYIHKSFRFDNTKPTGSIAFSKKAYNGTGIGEYGIPATAVIEYSDFASNSDEQGSGVAYMAVAGDILNPTPADTWETISSSRQVYLSSENGLKYIKVKFKDAVGNVSSTEANEWIVSTLPCEVDTSIPTASITLYEEDQETIKANISSKPETYVVINFEDDAIGSEMEYVFWGDFENSPAEDNWTWTTITVDEGKTSKSFSVKAIAPADGVKAARYFNVKVRDAAGNVHSTAAWFELDTSAPEVEIEGPNYNNISKVKNVKRKINSVDTSDYVDTISFKISPKEPIVAWKVCAYTIDSIKDGTADDPAIGMTHGSIFMSGSRGTASNQPIDCSINGADFEIAIGGRPSETGEFDGAHIVVAYVQNEAGLWSKNIINLDE